MTGKTNPGSFFEDFRVGQEIVHATPRTVTEGDVALYLSLFGSRFALTSASTFAAHLGLERAPVDDLLAFHVVFGKTVPDISLNAVANLGYASGRFGARVYPGDTIATTSTVLGLRQNRNGKTGVVYVRSVGVNQRSEMVVEYTRWVMVRKRDPASPAPEPVVPELAEAVPVEDLIVPYRVAPTYDLRLAGSEHLFEDYEVGERIDHVDAMTIEESEHMTACRLFQNTAKVHFNLHVERDGRFGRRIIYGGYIISLARALSFNGLANAQSVAAINGGRHTAPTFAGDTVYAWSEVLDKMTVPSDPTLGALRVRTVATKDQPCQDFPLLGEDGKTHPAVVLDLDYTVWMPRRP
ncbi:MAG: MaoC family dehydratase [Sandaracinaceae bacterium]